ncbi:MAG: hypothetical protein RLZZ241_558 [Bacteroidota bacterium]
MKKFWSLSLFLLTVNVFGQYRERVITTAVPFLTIASDARASAMGDMGVATTTDAFSQQWNPSKYAFLEGKMGVAISYTPYLESIGTDIALLNATFYNKVSPRGSFASSIRYFTLGEIELRNTFLEDGTLVKPNELAFDGTYALKLSDAFSMAVTGRFISSNLEIPALGNAVQSGKSFAVDISGYYLGQEKAYSGFNGRWRSGFNLSNLGSKIRYDLGGQENFLPTNLALGTGFDFIFDGDNMLAITAQVNKLLVPTPRDMDGDGDMDSVDNDLYQQIGFFEGMFQSFSDAPDGFSEELQEATWSLGAEYAYRDQFMLRSGYFHESDLKGFRRFFSLGAGFKYNNMKVDLAYLFSTAQVRNPLENTLRFSLSFNLGEQQFTN